MAGKQSFNRRVTLPLLVIVTTITGLLFVGSKLWNIEESSVAESAAPVDPTAAASALPSSSAEASAKPTVDANGRLPVIVLNGTETAGLAKSKSEELHDADWVIDEIGNWTGEPVLETTIFYPPTGFSSAEELAALTGGAMVEATADMSQTALTLVVIQ
jgi:hypothetical protein